MLNIKIKERERRKERGKGERNKEKDVFLSSSPNLLVGSPAQEGRIVSVKGLELGAWFHTLALTPTE